jgi:hypothetical protein
VPFSLPLRWPTGCVDHLLVKRLAVVGLSTVLGCVLLVAVIVTAVVAAAIVRGSRNEDKDVRCPSSSPAACVGQLADTWHVDASAIPTIELPAELHFDGGSISKTDPAKSVFFSFHLVETGRLDPVFTNMTLIMTPGWSLEGRHLAPHKTVQLANGRSCLDFTKIVGKNVARVGPIVERVGNFTVQTSVMIVRPPWAPMRSAALDLLASVRAEP